MNEYENVILSVEDYLSCLGEFNSSGHLRKGEYRRVFNNWYGCCESFIELKVDEKNSIISYKMYYNGIKAKTREQRRNLSEYFVMANKSAEHYTCFAGLNDDGAAYVEIKLDYDLFPVDSEKLQLFERICTTRIIRDKILVKMVI